MLVKVDLHLVEENENFCLIFVAAEYEHLNGFSINPCGSDVTFAFTPVYKRTFQTSISKKKRWTVVAEMSYCRRNIAKPFFIACSFGRSPSFYVQKLVGYLSHGNYIHHYSFDHCNSCCFYCQKSLKNRCPSKGGTAVRDGTLRHCKSLPIFSEKIKYQTLRLMLQYDVCKMEIIQMEQKASVCLDKNGHRWWWV